MATVGQTRIEVGELVERILARAGVEPIAQTPDRVYVARVNLHYKLAALAGQGLYPWQRSTALVQTAGGQAGYVLPPGTVDVLNVNRRQFTEATGVVSGSASQQVSLLDTPGRVVMAGVGVTAAANGLSNILTVETNDGVVWRQRAVGEQVWGSTKAWFEVDGVNSAVSVRVTRTGLGDAVLSGLTVASSYHDTPLGVFNQTDRADQPDWATTSLTFTSYFFDKQAEPILWLWRPPSDASFLVWLQYQHQGVDVPELYETIAIPTVFYHALIDQVAFETRKDIERQGMEALAAAADLAEKQGERVASNGAPTRLQPNLRRYTR